MTFPEHLLEGYKNFRNGQFTEERRRYAKLAERGQAPQILVVACCDSRAAPETVFNASPGELFVVRNVANLVPPYAPDGNHHATSAAVEFAVLALAVKHIVIMGHGRCGGIKAVVEGAEPLSRGDFIGQWMGAVRDVYETVSEDEGCGDQDVLQTRVERASVEHSLTNLRTFPWLRQRESRNELSLHGAWFDIGLGELHIFDEQNYNWNAIC